MERHLASWRRMLEQKLMRNQPRAPSLPQCYQQTNLQQSGSSPLSSQISSVMLPSESWIHTWNFTTYHSYILQDEKKCKKESSFVNFMCSSARYSIPLWESGGMSDGEERRNKVANVARYHVRVSLELCWVHIWQSMRRMQHCQHEAARKSWVEHCHFQASSTEKCSV